MKQLTTSAGWQIMIIGASPMILLNGQIRYGDHIQQTVLPVITIQISHILILDFGTRAQRRLITSPSTGEGRKTGLPTKIYLIPCVIQHAIMCRAPVTLVVPDWPSTPFQPILFPEEGKQAKFVREVWVLTPEEFTICLGRRGSSLFKGPPILI